ncbi:MULTISPECIES: RNA polymerase sigma factor [Brevundimonas]|uniref:RNA polymerase sigma factor n=1 Tax=Brevundimonas TaxID=41275 RepID=UPI001F1DECDB|nr:MULTISPECIES: RNA polymerase sigma factor [Brevundimonas]
MKKIDARALDGYLVVSAQAGDRVAYERLARRWDRRLVAHAWRLTGDMDLARDVAQSAWIEIAKGLAGLRDEVAFPAWAYRIVTRRCARAIGRRQQDRVLAQALASEALADPVEPRAFDAPPLTAAIRALPASQRAAVGLFYFEELSVAETAAALDVPVGTVKTRLMHARRALRAVLEGEGHA